MSDDDLSMKATLDASQAISAANKLTDSIANLNQATGHTDKNLQAAEQASVKVTAAMQQYSKAVDNAAQAQSRLRSNTNLKNFSVFGKAQDSSVASQVPKAFSFYSARDSFKPDAYNGAIEAQRQVVAGQQQIVGHNERIQKSFEGMASARYALYDVSRVLTVISAASLGAVAANIKLEASYESLLVQVQRTSQTSGDSWNQLRTDLIDLTTEIPATIEDVSAIATLGGQLGIASGDIDAFTESVIKFSATTDVSASAAAESLGRIAQLSGVDSSQYDELAASIYQVGITSISTESDILAVAQQIAVSAKSAGFAADQTIALASALASLGVAPERARGSIQRVFNIIENSVSDGGDTLKQFASVSGITAAQFATDWNGDPQKAFQEFLAGLGRADAAGNNMNNILSDLGIKAVRDTDALKRLAQNTDVYTKAIDEASQGWNDGSVFAEGYAQVADTLDSKLTVLSSTLKAILEAAQDNTALKKFIDLLQAVANVALAIARSPVGAVFTTIALTVGALVGGLALLGAGAAAAYASLLAMVTAMSFMTKETVAGVGALRLLQISLLQVTGAAKGMSAAQIDAALTNGTLSLSLRGAGASATFATTAMKAFKGALITTGIGAALVAVGMVAESLYSSAQDTKAAAKELQDSFSSALAEDTSNADSSIRELTKSASNAQSATEELASSVQNSSLTFVGLKVDAKETSKALDDVVVSMGAVTEQAVRNNLSKLLLGGGAFGEDLEKQQQYMDRVVKGLEATGYTVDQITTAVLTNDTGFLQQIEDAAIASQYALQANGDGLNSYNTEAGQTNATLVSFIGQVQGSASALDVASQAMLLTKSANDATGASALATADSLSAEEQAALDTNDAVKNLAEGLFDVINAQSAIIQSTFDLGGALQQNGTDFSTYTEGGRANIAAFSQAISNAAAYAGDDTALFTSLVEQMISQLEAAGAVGVRQIAKNAGALSQGTATAASKIAAMTLLTGQVAGGFNKAAQSAKKVGSNTADATKQVRTLSDYVSDLSKVFKDAFDFRFGFDMAQDDTADSFRKIADSIKEAENNARDLRNTFDSLTSDKSILEYQLTVANAYSDDLRAEAIRAKLEKTNADLADTTQELADQQDFLTKNLEGDTAASADHRDMVRALFKAYENQLTAYANTGASQQQVARYSDTLKQKFEDQLRVLGYNTTQVDKYAASFNDLTAIINAVPRDLTVDTNANTDPAQRALDEFFANNTDRSVSIDVSANTASLSSAVERSTLTAQILGLTAQLGKPGLNGTAKSAMESELASLVRRFNSIPAYAKGGQAPPGWILAGENGPELIKLGQSGYVYTASQTQQMMEAARSGRGVAPAQLAVSSGSRSAQMGAMDLSAMTLQQLQSMFRVNIYLDGRKFASSMSGQFENSTRVGAS